MAMEGDRAQVAEQAEAALVHGIRLEAVKHRAAKRGFVLLPRRWVTERSSAWAGRFRRLAWDYEKLETRLKGLHLLALLQPMLRNIAKHTREVKNRLWSSGSAYPSVPSNPYLQAMDCIFCKIASGAVAVDLLHQDEQIAAFHDLHPQAPVHFLVIPRRHLQSLAHTAREDAALLGHMLAAAAELASAQGLAQGFRTVINAGEHGGQTVNHLHMHVLGGRQLGWPPG